MTKFWGSVWSIIKLPLLGKKNRQSTAIIHLKITRHQISSDPLNILWLVLNKIYHHKIALKFGRGSEFWDAKPSQEVWGINVLRPNFLSFWNKQRNDLMSTWIYTQLCQRGKNNPLFKGVGGHNWAPESCFQANGEMRVGFMLVYMLLSSWNVNK